MIGIIPTNNKSYDVSGMFCDEPIEGNLYVDPVDLRVYYYSKIHTRPNAITGFFPIWTGSIKYDSNFSNNKYLDRDVILTDINIISSKIDDITAEDVKYKQRLCEASDKINIPIRDNDNIFTQIIKEIFKLKNITIIDLVDMCDLKMEVLQSYVDALSKISFMRVERWEIWINQIFHLNYTLSIYRGSKKLLSFHYPSGEIECVDDKLSPMINDNKDYLKQIIKILMLVENINKTDLRSNEITDYTINNFMVTLITDKPLSAQLFSRFIRMTGLSYIIEVFEGDNKLLEYREDRIS